MRSEDLLQTHVTHTFTRCGTKHIQPVKMTKAKKSSATPSKASQVAASAAAAKQSSSKAVDHPSAITDNTSSSSTGPSSWQEHAAALSNAAASLSLPTSSSSSARRIAEQSQRAAIKTIAREVLQDFSRLATEGEGALDARTCWFVSVLRTRCDRAWKRVEASLESSVLNEKAKK